MRIVFPLCVWTPGERLVWKFRGGLGEVYTDESVVPGRSGRVVWVGIVGSLQWRLSPPCGPSVPVGPPPVLVVRSTRPSPRPTSSGRGVVPTVLR